MATLNRAHNKPGSQIYSVNSWISNGLRLFWEIAIVFRLAMVAFSKQYCLSDPAKRESELYCAGPVPLRRNVDARSGTSRET